MEKQYGRLKAACYTTNMAMSVVGNLSPVLFLTFRSLYGISYSLLGFLVLVNFVTQLTIDLIFSFFSHKFNIPKVVKITPALTVVGLLIYAIWPMLAPDSAYLGLVVGTVIFSASGGLVEVLLTPVIGAIPSKNPDRELSKLHSIYAWGVVFVIVVSTLFLLVFGHENWGWLALLFAVIPFAGFLLFLGAEVPEMETPEKVSGVLKLLQNKGLWLCLAAIFLGGISECTMAQWSSGYLEQALGIPKVWGDICGVALFSVMLGMGRSLYAARGKNPEMVLLCGAIGACVCYLTAAITNLPLVGLIACACTGFFVSMLWPGSLIVVGKRFPAGGVFVFAAMAAAGDLGASVGPQLIGIVTDAVIASPGALETAARFGLLPEQLGMKVGLMCALIFPVIAIFLYLHILKTKQK